MDDPIGDNVHVTWAPDSERVAVVNAPRGIPQLSIVPSMGPARVSIDLGGPAVRPTSCGGHRMVTNCSSE